MAPNPFDTALENIQWRYETGQLSAAQYRQMAANFRSQGGRLPHERAAESAEAIALVPVHIDDYTFAELMGEPLPPRPGETPKAPSSPFDVDIHRATSADLGAMFDALKGKS